MFIADENRKDHINAFNDSFNKLTKTLAEKINEEELFSFLAFLWKFHNELKTKEKYKLMWNLETYITECIHLLTDKNIDFEYIYTHHKKLVA